VGLQAPRRQKFEGWGVAVVNKVAIDIEESLAVRSLEDAVSRPDLLEHRSSRSGGHEQPPLSRRIGVQLI
jgi:hypothetical protein